MIKVVIKATVQKNNMEEKIIKVTNIKNQMINIEVNALLMTGMITKKDRLMIGMSNIDLLKLKTNV